MRLLYIVLIVMLLNISIVWANKLDIVIVGLFSDQAVVEINGKQENYKLGSYIGSSYTPPVQPIVSIWPTNGMYMTQGNINGFGVDFLVDTGASSIALNTVTAKRLGLDYLDGRVTGVRTASGIEKAYQITLDQVQVGDIKLYNVEALVLDGEHPSPALLGMSFLGQLDMERKGERMDIKKKY